MIRQILPWRTPAVRFFVARNSIFTRVLKLRKIGVAAINKHIELNELRSGFYLSPTSQRSANNRRESILTDSTCSKVFSFT